MSDPDVKAFIEKCIAPAAQRLPAKELLKDPFIQINGLNGPLESCPLPLPNTLSPKMDTFEENCTHNNESCASSRNLSLSFDIDFDNTELPLITLIKNPGDESNLTVMEAKKAVNGKRFILKGERNDDKSMSLLLRIEHGPCNLFACFDFVSLSLIIYLNSYHSSFSSCVQAFQYTCTFCFTSTVTHLSLLLAK